MILSLLLIGIVSAHGYDYKEKISETKYFPKDHYAVSRTTYISYDNDNRHSTYDYRHGYSYRTTTEYLDEHYKKTKKAHRKYFDDDKKDYYSVYVPYLKKYEKRACYPSAPKGKLFYVRCP
jgi:hypothetical protein